MIIILCPVLLAYSSTEAQGNNIGVGLALNFVFPAGITESPNNAFV